MARPVIGVTARTSLDGDSHSTISLQAAYIEAVHQAGGVALALPCTLPEEARDGIYPRLDGVLFSGGGDIAPERFSGSPHPRLFGLDPARDAYEFAILNAAIGDGKPFLGICRGLQVLNVATGGTLYTHLPDQMPQALDHNYPSARRTAIAHTIEMDGASKAAALLGETALRVNSLHHQGVKDVGTGLRAVGRSVDGLVEALELREHPFCLAVQWHPEWLTDQPAMRRLFSAFIQACSR